MSDTENKGNGAVKPAPTKKSFNDELLSALKGLKKRNELSKDHFTGPHTQANVDAERRLQLINDLIDLFS